MALWQLFLISPLSYHRLKKFGMSLGKISSSRAFTDTFRLYFEFAAFSGSNGEAGKNTKIAEPLYRLLQNI